ALQPPADAATALSQEFVAPRNATEAALAEIWKKVLAVPRVGIHDNFFELGGHSLVATQIVFQAGEALGLEVPLRALFEKSTVAGLAEAIALLQQAKPVALERIPRVARRDELPLSFAQRRFWFFDQLVPDCSAYNIFAAIRLQGALNLPALEKSLTELVKRHESLRTTFPSIGGEPVQRIAPPTPYVLPVTWLDDLPETEREVAALRFANEEAKAPFNLGHGPLFRCSLIRLSESDHLLLVKLHHIISDGWSFAVFNRELAAFYDAFTAGQSPALPEPPIQYGDYAVWQRNRLQGEFVELQLTYWKQQLEGIPTLLELPADRPRPAVQSFRGAHVSFALPKELAEKLKSLSRQAETTLFMTLMAAFQALMSRYSGQEKLIVSTGIANRDPVETQSLIGCLINILLLRADFSGNPSFQKILADVREVALGAYAHQDLPFEHLVEALAPERDLSYNQLTQVMFVFLKEPMDSLSLPGIRCRAVDVMPPAAAYDLVLHLWEAEGSLAGFFNYSTDLFDASTIERMIGHFTTLLEAVVADPRTRLLELPLLTRAEHQKVLFDWNDTCREFPRDKCLHELFELQVARDPGAVAIFFGDEQVTYGELEQRANRLAHYLQKRGVGPDKLVGICVERSVEMVVGILSIMKAGGAYIPLDPNYPQERLNFMLEDTHASIVLTQERLRASLSAVHGDLICLDSGWSEIAEESAEKPASSVDPANLSYVIYTSGSTGTPKGIAIFHRGVLNNVIDLNWRHGVGPRDRVLCLSSLSFDMCVYEIFGPLEAGGAIVMPPPEWLREPARWAELVFRHQVTIWNSAPALLKMYVDYVTERPDLWPNQIHLAILGGDWIPVNLPDRLRAMAPKLRFIALGGAMEASIHSIIYQADKTDPKWKSIPYGKPQWNQKTYILNPCLQPAPIGVAGELFLGGIGLARGYFDRPEQTVERFLPNPFAAEPGERIYRTGDLARYLPDGNIELLGRMDYQVKLRGLRIECGEIEAVLRQHPAVREAVVAASQAAGGDKQLVAYVRPRRETALPICQLLAWEKQGLLKGWEKEELPNGQVVLCHNRNEAQFTYHEIFEEEGYFKKHIHLPDGACIFDVGANIGMFAMNAAQHCRNPRLYCFEPIPPVFETLKLNTALHGVSVKVFQCALSQAAGQATFTYYPHLSLISSRFADSADDRKTVKDFLKGDLPEGTSEELLDELLAERMNVETVTCEMKTLSQVMREENVNQIDLLKIDVEKSELEVLAGIEPEDWGKIQQLLIEVYDKEGRLDWVANDLRQRGYTVTIEGHWMVKDSRYRNLYATRAAAAAAPNGIAQQETLPAVSQWSSPDRLANDLRAFAKGKLPDYMVPSAIVLMEELPLSPNGKIDRKALAAVQIKRPKSDQNYVGPRNQEEEILAGIYAKVLMLERVGIHDNFFELGGHSLMATQVITQIRGTFHVELPLRTLFEAPTVAKLAEAISLAQQTETADQPQPLVRVPRTGRLPLSFAQYRLWFLDQLLPNSAAYNISFAIDLLGELQFDALDHALREIVRRHEALRTTFPTIDGEPAQVIHDGNNFQVARVDLSHLDESKRAAEAQRLIDAEAGRPFDLAAGPLFRATVLVLSADKSILLLTMPHIVSDGWSLGILSRELTALYAANVKGKTAALPELPIQYVDYAIWQRQWLQGAVLDQQLAYWKKQLAGVPTKLELPTDRQRPAVQTLRGARYFLKYPAALMPVIEALSRAEGATVFMTLMAAFKSFLHAYTSAEDIVVGSPFSNRTRAETESLVGSFVNTLVLRTSLASDPTFLQVMARAREVVLGADAHQSVPLEKIVEVVRPPRDPSRNPLFQINFRVVTGPLLPLQLTGLKTQLHISECQNSKFDLAMELWLNNEGFGGFIEYCSDLFDLMTIQRMSGEFERLLSELIARPDVAIHDLATFKEIRNRSRASTQPSTLERGQTKPKDLRQIKRKGIDLAT
ncbi:MAG: amino acid adenylation domain-containing protein, partial [Verrucomicrobia bacterium]|nr:amino acid adenylation domain-containing protein [Verrucomicrobiota bacterium]